MYFFEIRKFEEKVATFIDQGSQTGQEFIFPLFFFVRTFQNLTGIDVYIKVSSFTN